MERKNYISVLRVAAMFAVIATHVCTTAWTDFPGFTKSGGALYRSIISVCHFAVPVFFMITGALMLDSERNMNLEKLLKKYIVKYALVIFVFCWAFSFIEVFFGTRTISFGTFFSSFLNMLQGKSWAHMWYMYTLLGVMFIVPVLRFITKYADKKTVDFIMITGIIFLSMVPIFETYTDIKFGVVYPVSIIYPLYMLLGYWLDKEMYKISSRTVSLMLVGISVALIVLSVLQQYYGYSNAYASYNSPLILLLSISIFSYFKNKRLREYNVLFFIDKLSFGVYIIHMFWINLIYKFFKINPFTLINPLVGFLIFFILVSCCSVISAYIMKKIPFIKRIV